MLKENDISLVQEYIWAKHYHNIKVDYKKVSIKDNYDYLHTIFVYITYYNLIDSYINCKNLIMYNQLKDL